MKKYLWIVGVMVIVVGVYLFGRSSQPSTVPEPSTSKPATTSTQPTAAAPATSSTTNPALPPIDASWKTFTNTALKFQFQYPIHGSYAPHFAIQFLNASDSRIKDGCFIDQGMSLPGSHHENVTVNGIDFCHTGYADHATLHAQEHDFWTTKKGKQFIVVGFDSPVYISDMSVIEGCQPGGRLLGTATCKPYDVATYQDQLTQIMSTFKYTE